MSKLHWLHMLLMGLVAISLSLAPGVVQAQGDDDNEPPEVGWLIESSVSEGGVRAALERLDWDSRAAIILEELADPAFDRYVDMSAVAEAAGSLDPVLLTDVALQIAEGERVLCRPRKGIGADKLFELAVKVAVDKQDKETLARLKKAATVLGKKGLAASVGTATKLAGETRSVDPASLVPVDGMSEEIFWSLKVYLDSLRRVRLLGDVEELKQLQASLSEEVDLPKKQLEYLKKLADQARAAMPDKSDPQSEALQRLSGASRGDSYDSNRNRVRSNIVSGGWNPVYGELINEAEYLKFAASAYAGNPGAYFKDYYRRTVARMKRELPNVAANSVENAVMEALRGRNVRLGKYGIKGGIATYQRWKSVSAHLPDGTEKYKIYGPRNPFTGKRTWTWGYRPRMKLVKKRLPLPNHHQPYIAFRYYTTSSGGGGSSSGGGSSEASNGIRKRWRVTNNTSDRKTLHVRVYRAESPGRDGSKKWHSELEPGETMTFSGHGRGSSGPYMLISYWNQKNNAQPRGRIDAKNIHYKFTGRRGALRYESRGAVPSR